MNKLKKTEIHEILRYLDASSDTDNFNYDDYLDSVEEESGSKKREESFISGWNKLSKMCR